MTRLVQVFIVIAIIGATIVAASLVLREPQLRYTTSKVCQVTGVVDRERPDQRTGVHRTGLTGGVTGTDLGFPLEHSGRLLLLFGDSREFHPDRCEPAWCGTDSVKDNPPTGLKRWRTQDHWNAWVASREEGADSIATAPLEFDPEQCIPVSFETDERGSVYAHAVSDSIGVASRLTGPPVASRPEDKWVTFVDGRLLVITATGQTFVHPLAGDVIGTPFQLSGPPVAARPEDKWIVAVGDRLLVGTTDGRVFAHRVTPTAVEPAIQLSGAKVAARAEDRWVLTGGGDKLFVITNDGRGFVHPISGNTIGPSSPLIGPAVAARPQDKWVLFLNDRLLVGTKDGDVFFHSVENNVVGIARRLEGPYVAAQPQDRRVIAAQNRILVLTGPDGRFRPTQLDGRQAGRKEGAIGAFTSGFRIFTFFTMKNTQGHAHDDIEPGGKTVLSESTDGGRSFVTVAEVSTKKFLWTVPAVEPANKLAGIPRSMTGDVVLMWGAGRENMHGRPTLFHHSYPFLAVAPLESIADRSSWRYYAGTNAGVPRWVDAEQLATPIPPFGSQALDLNPRFGPGYHECLGYFNVRRIEAWSKWVMLYACNNDAKEGYNPNNGPRGIYLRTADLPWGPWSEPRRVFDPDDGYCHFMHRQDLVCPEDSPNPAEASVRDAPKKPRSLAWGGEYAPILLPSRYVKVQGDATTLYFLMGTWNPYQVVLMRTQVTPMPWWQRTVQSVQGWFNP